MARCRARGLGFGVSSDATPSTRAATIPHRNPCIDVRQQRGLSRKWPSPSVIGWRRTIEA